MKVSAIAGAVALVLAGMGTASGAKAQSFDQQFNATLSQLMQQNANGQQQLFAQYVQAYGPWLQQQYVATGSNRMMSFQQFAWYSLMSANGTNPQAGLQAQQQQFAGLQGAHQTVMQGYSDYNAGWAANSTAQTNVVENYSRQAIQGNAPYTDPSTGARVDLPYAAQPRQPFRWGGEVYVRDDDGTFYRRQGNGWVEMVER